MDQKYKDMLDMPHHVSVTHPQMSMDRRAAQFSPFAALTGYGNAVEEAARLTDQKAELTDELLDMINRQLTLLSRHLQEKPVIRITYFQMDDRKDGGSYTTVTGIVKKIDKITKMITMDNGTEIPMGEISAINGELFRKLE
ncbi:MAG TPA: YolD-like family protein [Candidatus Blautia faecavium]|uniref:YolD-like family protein n=1 Tax=Candidatus Blautia faecavium TaxID=2838487 RepID=A0A9D2LUM5_9FIRM|nr:YolD-like family protein [Candidatus Blautia faecavium]